MKHERVHIKVGFDAWVINVYVNVYLWQRYGLQISSDPHSSHYMKLVLEKIFDLLLLI